MDEKELQNNTDAERYRLALEKILAEVDKPPYTLSGRKAWIRHICQEALSPQECDAHLFEEGLVSKLNGRCRCGVCGRCHHHTANSTQGHYWQRCKVTGTLREFHFCCPDPVYGCELEQGKKQDA